MAHSTPASDGAARPDGSPYRLVKDESEWQAALDPLEYHVLREAGTEAKGDGQLECPSG